MTALDSMRYDLRAMTRQLRELHQQQVHQGLRAMVDEASTLTREAVIALKHAAVNQMTQRKPAVHKSLAPYTGVTVSPLTPPESARFYDWMNGRPAAR